MSDPHRYGIIEFDKHRNIKSIEEKPLKPKSNFAVTGLYFYDENVLSFAKELKPSDRGELEITDINKKYLEKQELEIEIFSRGMAWLDTGTFDALHEAGSFIRTIEKRQGMKVGCPEEISWRSGFIDDRQLQRLGEENYKTEYGKYLINLLSMNQEK